VSRVASLGIALVRLLTCPASSVPAGDGLTIHPPAQPLTDARAAGTWLPVYPVRMNPHSARGASRVTRPNPAPTNELELHRQM